MTGETGKVVVSEAEIRQTVRSLAIQIVDHYGPQIKDVHYTIILEGARRFGADLLQHLPTQPQVHTCKATSYQGTSSTGKVALEGFDAASIAGGHILLIEDIYDTGHTLTALKRTFNAQGAIDVKVAVLLEKQRPHEYPLHIDFIGRQVPDQFLIGYGLDYHGQYRDLNDITTLAQK